ncbi:MAG: hypothetical protein J7K40_14280 [candidate division Zixibacteria bacterium]|nr:hypothetical protein [candidate division Zixibacteria bacterium]
MIITKKPFYPTSKISFYSNRVLKNLNLKEPPIFTKPVLEYFGIKLSIIDTQSDIDFEKEYGIKFNIPAFLYNHSEKPKIFVREDDNPERRKLSIMHECGVLIFLGTPG